MDRPFPQRKTLLATLAFTDMFIRCQHDGSHRIPACAAVNRAPPVALIGTCA
jgi:hypothetical protein